MKSLLTLLFVVISGPFSYGCSVKDALIGNERTDVSQIQIGWDRGQVDELLDAPIDAFECPSGTRAKYVYDRFPSDEPEPGLATVMAAFSLFTLGMNEFQYDCQEMCQRGILEIVFDDNQTVVLLRPLSDPYDVGVYCRSGDVWRDFCMPARDAASKMDARVIHGADDQLIKTGCFADFSTNCNLAHSNDPHAQYRMGNRYRYGEIPVTVSRAKAYMWFTLALQGGELNAQDGRDAVAAMMSANELADAERLLAEWQPDPDACGTRPAQ